MGRIQTDVGLITGIPIGDTVEKLMQLAARPRDMLVERTDALKQEQTAVTELTTLLASVQYVAKNLTKEDLFDRRTITSSNEAVVTATASNSARIGNYQITPLRLVQNQQLISSGFESSDAPLGGGILRLRLGRRLNTTVPLDVLRGNEGFVPGAIRITDRSGASAVIDLSEAQSLDDVLQAINSNTVINVTAVLDGDRIKLIDNTGQAVSNLKVQEVAGGRTAWSLGLATIDSANSVAWGEDILWLTESTRLDLLNDGTGVDVNRYLPDIQFQLRDGTTGTIDLAAIASGTAEEKPLITLADVLEAFNSAAPGKLELRISADGDRLELVDLTTGTGEFVVQAINDSQALHDLGLDRAAVNGVITGRRLLGGLGSVLLDSLNGGKGLGQLGSITITDRTGQTATVDLSGAETLDDIIRAINSANVAVEARVSRSGTGLEIVDLSGAAASNFIIANADQTNTASKLGIAANVADWQIESGDLHLQIISYNTRLDTLNGNRGVARGTFTIYDSTGASARVDLRSDDIQTIGDVLRAINRLDIGVEAVLNETGDGIMLIDTAGGSQRMRVEEGESTTAADLHLLGSSRDTVYNGETVQAIDGSTTFVITLNESDTLQDLVEKINDLNAGIHAAIVTDGSARPYRLALTSEYAGQAGNWLVDAKGGDFEITEIVHGQDALVRLGDATGGLLVTSSSNTFDGLIPGVTFTVKQPSETPVVLTVSRSDTDLVASVQTLVDNYNKFRDRLKELTAYDPNTDQRSPLTGDATALRLDQELLYLLSDTFNAKGEIISLRQIGVTLNGDGSLSFDASVLEAKFAEDPDAVRKFFADKTDGFAVKFDQLLERLAGVENSLLSQRLEALQEKISDNQEKIDWLNERLDRERERLLLEFYRMELAVAKILSNQSLIEKIKPIEMPAQRKSEQ